MRSLRAAVAACCVTLVGVTGCGGAGRSPGTVATGTVPSAKGALVRDGTFRYALDSDPGSLDVTSNVQTAAFEVVALAYDGLVSSMDGKAVVSNIASKWTRTASRLTFTIRDGVVCSDGSKVTTSTVVRSFEYLRRPESSLPVFGDVSDWDVKGDARAGTVTFSFKSPVGFPLQALTSVPVICGKGLKEPKLLKRQTSGTGPYVLTESAPNDHYVLERRDGYDWGPDGASTAQDGLPARIELRVVEDPATKANLVVSGALDAAVLTPQLIERLGGGARVLAVPSSVSQALFNHGKDHPSSDVAVRRALVMALDRPQLTQVAQGKPAANLVPALTNPCVEPGNGRKIPAFDLEGAAKLLDEAGWVKGADGKRAKDGKRLTLHVLLPANATPAEAAAAELTNRSWRSLGIEVKSRTLAETPLNEAIFAGAWDALPGINLSVVVPSQLAGFLSGPAPPKGANFAAIDNPAYDQAARRALAQTSDDEACADWNAAERVLYEQADIVPVFTADQLWAQGNRVDFRVNASGIVPTSIRMHAG